MEKEYFKFFLNGRQIDIDKNLLYEYEFFKKVITDTDFKREDINIDFDIGYDLALIAHYLEVCDQKFNLQIVIQIYDYLNYFTPIDINKLRERITNIYLPNGDDDLDLIDDLDEDTYDRLKILLKFKCIDSDKYYIEVYTTNLEKRITEYGVKYDGVINIDHNLPHIGPIQKYNLATDIDKGATKLKNFVIDYFKYWGYNPDIYVTKYAKPYHYTTEYCLGIGIGGTVISLCEIQFRNEHKLDILAILNEYLRYKIYGDKSILISKLTKRLFGTEYFAEEYSDKECF